MDLILNKNTAHDYTMEAAYESYIQNRIDQENRINNLLAECTILNEANTGIITKTRQISVLYEANLKDNIKAKFNKFIQFLKNIWGKFMSNMTKALGDEKTYLEKYSDIINKQKGKSDIKVSYYGNYNKAVDRINRVIVPPFDWNTMHEALSDEENAYGKFFALNKISGMNDFEYDENNELAAQLKEYFIAGEDGQTDTTMDKIDLKSAYNFCWNFKKIQQVTEKDIKNMESSAMKIDQAVNNKLAENPNAKPETAQGGSKEESAIIGLREDGESSDDNNNNGNDGDKPTTSTTLNISKGSGSFQRQDTNTQKANTDTQTSAIMDKQGDKSNADYSKEVSNVIDNYMTVCRAVITAKWTGAQQIAKDYMNIIKAHVNSYVGTDMGKGNNNNSKAKKYTTDKGKGLSNDKTNNNNNDNSNNNNDKQQQNDNSEQQGQQQQQVQQTNANVNANKFSRINRRSRRR